MIGQFTRFVEPVPMLDWPSRPSMTIPSEKERLSKLWKAVFQPAADLALPPSLPERIPGEAFALENALILAWLCHAVYVEDTEARTSALQQAGFKEAAHHSTRKLHWSLVHPSDQPRHQILVFRGTSDLQHWLYNLNTLLTVWPPGGKVHGGFAAAYRKLSPDLASLLTAQAPERLWITGHSLGGALALFAATEFPAEVVYTFGCPRAGNPSFAKLSSQTPTHRIIHEQDLVTTIPYEISFLQDLAYSHTGTTVHLRRDHPPAIDDATHLPHSVKSWKHALHAMCEGDHLGEPLPAIQDHAPSSYVRALREAVAGPGI